MARRAQPEPVDARLLKIAAAHIRRHGIAKTTIVSIAAEAGMSHANVYRYFPSKWALFEALPGWAPWAGAPFVIGSGLYIRWRERVRAREKTQAAIA